MAEPTAMALARFESGGWASALRCWAVPLVKGWTCRANVSSALSWPRWAAAVQSGQ
jgi:hypothetical protein